MTATLGRTSQERTRWTKMASDVHAFLNILTHAILTHVCIPMSQWKSSCFSAACPLWLFQLSSRQPKLNLLHRTLPGALMWFTAPMRSNLEETNCLTKHSKACFLAQNACTEATNSSAAIPMSQWKCVHTYESMKNRLFLGSLSAVTLSSFFETTKAESFAKPSKA